MRYDKAEPLNKRPAFDELGEKSKFTTANGTEKAYHRAVEHLALLMAEDNTIRVVTVKQESVTRIKRNSPPPSTCIRQTAMANEARSILIL